MTLSNGPIEAPVQFCKKELLQQAHAHYQNVKNPNPAIAASRNWLPILEQQREIPILKFQHTRTTVIPHELHQRLFYKPAECGIQLRYGAGIYTIVAIDADDAKIEPESFIRFVALTPSVHIIH